MDTYTICEMIFRRREKWKDSSLEVVLYMVGMGWDTEVIHSIIMDMEGIHFTITDTGAIHSTLGRGFIVMNSNQFMTIEKNKVKNK